MALRGRDDRTKAQKTPFLAIRFSQPPVFFPIYPLFILFSLFIFPFLWCE
jgi:hypothetical protein